MECFGWRFIMNKRFFILSALILTGTFSVSIAHVPYALQKYMESWHNQVPSKPAPQTDDQTQSAKPGKKKVDPNVDPVVALPHDAPKIEPVRQPNKKNKKEEEEQEALREALEEEIIKKKMIAARLKTLKALERALASGTKKKKKPLQALQEPEKNEWQLVGKETLNSTLSMGKKMATQYVAVCFNFWLFNTMLGKPLGDYGLFDFLTLRALNQAGAQPQDDVAGQAPLPYRLYRRTFRFLFGY